MLSPENLTPEQKFKMGFRSVYRPEKNRPGDKVHFVGDERGYIVGESGNLLRAQPKHKGKKAVKAAKRARRNGK